MKILVLTDDEYQDLRDILANTYTFEKQVERLEHILDLQESIQKDLVSNQEILALIETFESREPLL